MTEKELCTLHLDADALEYFRRTGRGWGRRAEDVLRSYVNYIAPSRGRGALWARFNAKALEEAEAKGRNARPPEVGIDAAKEASRINATR